MSFSRSSRRDPDTFLSSQLLLLVHEDAKIQTSIEKSLVDSQQSQSCRVGGHPVPLSLAQNHNTQQQPDVLDWVRSSVVYLISSRVIG